MTPSLPRPDRCHSAAFAASSPPLSPKLSKVFAQKKQRGTERKEKFGFSVERVRAGTRGDSCLGTFCGMETCLAVMKLKRRGVGGEKTQLWTFW